MDDIERALANALVQTGFPLEHYVHEEMVKGGWSLRPGWLYIDPDEEKTREIDLLALKNSRFDAGPVGVVTLVLVSCKARTAKPWVLLTRPWSPTDPDARVSAGTWSNAAQIQYLMKKDEWRKQYFQQARDAGARIWGAASPEEVFALQEFEAVKGPASTKQPTSSPKYRALGDSSLYEGAMTLLKSLRYEVDRLKENFKPDGNPVAIHYNLVQVLDGDLYQASFSTPNPEVRRVDRYRYFAKTMVAKKDISGRIDFCTKQSLAEVLSELSVVHEHNVAHFNRLYEDFYSALLEDHEKLNALMSVLEPRLARGLEVWTPEVKPPSSPWAKLSFRDDEQRMRVRLKLTRETVAELNAKPYFLGWVRESLRLYCRYSGPFILVADDFL